MSRFKLDSYLIIILILLIVLLLNFFKLDRTSGLFEFANININSQRIESTFGWGPEEWKSASSATKLLETLWRKPEEISEIDWENSKCSEFVLPIPFSFLNKRLWRSNPHLLQCYFQKQIPTITNGKKNRFGNVISFRKNDKSGFEDGFIVVYDGKKKIHFYLDFIDSSQSFYSIDKRVYKIIRRSQEKGGLIPRFGIKVNLKSIEWPNFSMTVFLTETGIDKILPSGQYFYGPEKSQLLANDRSKEILSDSIKNGVNQDRELLWDNFGREYFIDLFQVTVQEVNDYFLAIQQLQNLLPNQEIWNFPATHLSLDQQKSFCRFRGKELLTAMLFDAATFFKNGAEDPPQHSKYSWGKTDINQLSKNPKDICRFFLASKCLLNEENLYSPDNISWMGIYQIMGGYPESLDNNIVPYYNVKISNVFIENNSPLHFLGERLHWNGKFKDESMIEGGTSSQYNKIKNKNKIDNLGTAFRCYREGYAE